MTVISYLNTRVLFNCILATLFFTLFFLHLNTAHAQQKSIIFMDSITADEDEKKLTLPSTVMVDPEMDEIYIIDGRGRIIIYTSDLFPLYTLDRKHGIEAAQGLAMDSRRNLYVTQAATKDSPTPKISVFDSCLRWNHDIYIDNVAGFESFVPYRLAVDKKGIIYVVARNYPGVLALDNSGFIIDKIYPEEDGRKIKITDVTLDNAGKIYLVSEDESRIYIYDQNRELMLKFGEKGGSSGKLSRPKAVGIDEHTGTIYVADYMRHTVSVYDSTGKYISEFGGLGWNPGWFQHPIDITVDDAGRILVADFFNQRIQLFKAR
jgi:DNA-binding beta-propeller fold protein YncE